MTHLLRVLRSTKRPSLSPAPSTQRTPVTQAEMLELFGDLLR